MSMDSATAGDDAPRRSLAADGDAENFRFGRAPENLPFLEPAPESRVVEDSGVRVVDLDLRKRSDRALFLDMADPIYADDPNYISPLRMQFMKFLDPAKNPAFENLEHRALLAMRGEEPRARIIAHVDRAYCAYHGTSTGFFGFFESYEDRAAAHALLAEATGWLRSKGMVEVFGPMNFSTNHQVGLLVENFGRPPFVEHTYARPYYESLFTSFGFGKAKDLLVFMIDTAEGMSTPKRQRILKVAERVKKREGIIVRPANLKDAKAEIQRMYDIYMKAWEKNWGFAPASRKEFDFLMSDLATVAVADLVLFVEVNGRTVGFSATLPNVNEKMPRNGRLFPFNWLRMLNLKKTRSGRLISLGVLPEYRKRGLETIMFAETLLAGQRLKWEQGEIGWTLEDNDLINRAIESMEAWIDRRYRILGLRLEAAPASHARA